MDRSDSKASDFERRVSRRVSRTASVQTAGGGTGGEMETTQDPALNATEMTVADGFRPPNSNDNTAASNLGVASVIRRRSTSRASRPSISSSISPEGPLSTPPANSRFASDSVSSDASTSSSGVSSSSHRISISVTPPETRAASQSQQPSSVPVPVGMANRPSSISKPQVGSQSNSSSTVGGSMGSSRAAGSGTTVNAPSDTASSGAGSAGSAVNGEEPYQGPSGPSFPYQLYPQNVRLGRSLSSATASTAVQSESSYNGPRGPTFPYTLYPQNTMAGGQGTIPMNTIPVGFPGMSDNYQRRLGPEGEEIADMIGPDGHTEQLPPYSRYPDEAYNRKIAAGASAPGPDPLGSPVASAANGTPAATLGPSPASPPGQVPVEIEHVQPPAPVAVPPSARTSMLAAAAVPTAAAATTAPTLRPIAGAGGLGLASRNPEFDDLDSPQSRHSSRSFTSEASRHDINVAANDVNEKDTRRTRLQRVARKRLCGIVPYWAICLLVTALALMGIILGAVIGTFLSKHKKPPKPYTKPSYESPAVTVTVDATPIATPSNLPDLPTGLFGLPLQPNQTPSTCFNDTDQGAAWSCHVNYMSGTTVSITNVAKSNAYPVYNITVGCNETLSFENGIVYFGEQSPAFGSSTMQLVNDTLDLNRGPAWFYMMPYNKTVVVPQEGLTATPTGAAAASTATSSNSRRRRRGSDWDDLAALTLNSFHRKDVAKAGEKPWVCTWPDTVLEVFIYPRQNSSVYKMSQPESASSSSSSVSSASTAAGAGSGASKALHNNYHVAGASTSTSVTTPTLATTSTTTTTAEGVPTPSTTLFSDMPPPPPPYPRIVKMIERRMSNSRQATCVQYSLEMVGTSVKALPYLDEDGNQIQITIAEKDDDEAPGEAKRDLLTGEEIFRRGSSELSDCGCLWMLT